MPTNSQVNARVIVSDRLARVYDIAKVKPGCIKRTAMLDAFMRSVGH